MTVAFVGQTLCLPFQDSAGDAPALQDLVTAGRPRSAALRGHSSLRLSSLIQGFFGPQVIAFSAQFTLRCRCAGALFARPRLGPRKLLPLTRKARLPDRDACATGAFGTTLAAISLALVRISFARPIVLDHSATRTRRFQTGRFSEPTALRCFHCSKR